MRTSIALFVCLFSLTAFAGQIITDIGEIESLNKALRLNPYYFKIGPVKFKTDFYELGRSQTPFYTIDSQVKRFFRNNHKCFELTIFKKNNIVRNVSCHSKPDNLHLKGFEEFKVVSPGELLLEGLKGFRTLDFSQSFELTAFLQPYDMYILDLAVLGSRVDKVAPRRKFKTHFKAHTEIKVDKKGLKIHQEVELSVDQIGILNANSEKILNTIQVMPSGLIFSNGLGQLLIYNPALPKPFGDSELLMNLKVLSFLETLAQESLSSPVCFRDSSINQSKRDCHNLILKTHPLVTRSKMKIILLDFVDQRVEFLN